VSRHQINYLFKSSEKPPSFPTTALLIAYALLSLAAVVLMKARKLLPAILIGVSSLGLLFLNLMNLVQPALQTENLLNCVGQAVAASLDFTIWQNIQSWFAPFAIVAITFGVFILSKNQLNNE